jgi:hypothetical protein
MKSFVYSLIILAFCFSSLIAENITLKDGKSGVNLNLLSVDNSTTRVEFTFNSFSYEKVSINGKDFISVTAPNAYQLMEKGAPDLPMFRKSIIISDEKGVSYRIIETEYVTKKLGSLAPSKGHFTRNIEPSSVPYVFSKIFELDEFYPNTNFSLSSPYIVRDLRGVTMQFNPIQYNPVSKELKICTRLVVDIINDENSKPENPLVRNTPFKGISKDYNDVYLTLFANYGEKGLRYNFIPEPGRLLIIYAQNYENEVNTFYNWKISKGIPTIKAKYPTETGTGAAAIKTYIQNLYNSTEGITYIILVGESSEIPYLLGQYESAPSDPCYVKLAGNDAYPDAFIGRISPKSAANLAYIFEKIRKYEDEPFTGSDAGWYLKGMGVASDEGTPTDWQRANLLRTMFLQNMHFTSVDQVYDPGALSSTVTTNLNEGRSIINYIGHGSGTSWGTTSFSSSLINALSNGYKNPFVFDVACLNGNFTLAECMEEAWLRAGDLTNPKGAIAVYGSTTNASWVPPCDMQYHAMELLTTRQKMTVGGVCFSGLMHGMDINGGSTGEGLKMMEQFHIFGDPMTKLTFGLFPDSTAPTTITNLNASDPTSDEIMVTWSAPMDSSIGGVISYDLRFSTTQINNDNDFAAAQSVLLSGEGDTFGMPKSYTFKNLSFNTTYYFAIKSIDIWGNISQISNVTSATTLSAPVIVCTPDSFSYSMLSNNIKNDSLIISNASLNASTLKFNVETANSTFPEKTLQVNIIPQNQNSERLLGTKENPIEFGGISIKGHGGPDSFGYKWIDSDEENGPVYEWNDISTTGTEATNWIATGTYSAKDEGYTTINMGINFKFYGNVFSTIYASSNGFLSFTAPTTNTYTNSAIPQSATPNNLIAPFWDDLDGKTTGKVFYKTDGNKFIVQYYNWNKYSGSGVLNFQVVLYSSGKIMFYYGECTTTLNSATIGIENAAGNVGLQIVKDANYVKPNLAVKLSAEPEWMFMNNINAMIYNGNNAKVNLNINTDDLEDGIYTLDLKIKSNDPVNPVVLIPVKLTVGNVVPVELLSFNATVKNNIITINWTTATETNNNGFEIERKSDSKSWEKVGFVKGKGSTTEKQNYSYVDILDNVNSERLIYRLKQIDFDGTISYSKSIEVIFAPETYSLEQNFPNPFNPSTTIRFGLPVKSNVSIKVFNSLGQMIEEIVNGQFEAGYHSVMFNAANLSSGIYYYRIETEGFSQIKKMVLLK